MYRPPIDEITAILSSLSSFDGYNTVDDVLGTTIVCPALIGSNDFITSKTILIESGARKFEDRSATLFINGTGTITVAPAFGGPILRGTHFYVLNSVSPTSASAIFAALFSAITTTGGGSLAYLGVVDFVPGADQFRIPTLAGLGAGKFAGGTSPYRAFVSRKNGGGMGLPQGQMKAVTAYVTATGAFTAPGFGGGGVNIGDEVIILHPRIAEIYDILVEVVTDIGYEGLTDLAHKLTAARAALIDHLNADITTRAVPGDAMALTAAERLLVQALVISDVTPFAGADVGYILAHAQIRTVQSGVKAINGAVQKYLHIDSGIYGAEILSIAINGVIGHDWSLDVYVPADDAEAATQPQSLRDSITYALADTSGGLLGPLAIPFDAYLDFLNNGANSQITQVTVTYRSRTAITLTWEP